MISVDNGPSRGKTFPRVDLAVIFDERAAGFAVAHARVDVAVSANASTDTSTNCDIKRTVRDCS